MIRLNIDEVEVLQRHLDRLSKGEIILLCSGSEPIAEVRPLPRPRTEPRPIGLCKRQFTVPPEFFDQIPDEMLDAFERRG